MVRLPALIPQGESLVSWYAFGFTVLWPPMQVLTKREWRGVEHLGQPGDGRILAANHVSWFDPFVLAHFINDNGRAVRLLAKSSLFDVPLGGRVLQGTHQIPVYRESGDAAAAVDAAVQAVNKGEAVMIYPEGTITRDPDLWPMSGKTGAARIALKTRKPVIPIAQWGAQDVTGPYRIEAKLIPRKTMHVSAGPPVELSDLYSDEEPTQEVLAIATDRIMGAIADELGLLRGETPPEQRWNMKAGRREPGGSNLATGDG